MTPNSKDHDPLADLFSSADLPEPGGQLKSSPENTTQSSFKDSLGKSESSDPLQNLHVQGMYRNYFLDYASYVITDRAVPYSYDGLKPVQRRLLHSLWELDDGRFHKAANVIGNTMKYHPHGDAAIRDALVNLGQKNLLIETQGNWGDPCTGDEAAAPRYVECKLSPFALEIAFNKKTTQWQKSYDGRNVEPVCLPVKFPLLLAQGAEGIAVGLSTRILPHNFCELIENAIKILKGDNFTLYPDFPTGGSMDVSEYNDGKSGSRIKVRATITEGKGKYLVISEIPYGTTTTALMDSIVSANDKGKIKIRRIEDNTAQNVEILVYLSPGAEAQKTIDALYAFTDCEMSLSPNCCVIRDKRPVFLGVSELLRENVKDTVQILKMELEIKQHELEEKHFFSSLEKIFIENRIYRKIENATTWEAVIATIRTGLAPFKDKLLREITQEDIEKLTEIKIKRISKFDSDRADEILISLDKEIKAVKKNLRQLTAYAIEYFENLLKKYGKGRERKTRIEKLEAIAAQEVILANLKVYYDRESGFLGTGVRSEEFIPNCSALDDIVVFLEEGHMTVTRVAEKTYVGKNILHTARLDKNDDSTAYTLVYRDGKQGPVYIKRFAVGGITRDKVYILTKGTENSKVLFFAPGTLHTGDKLKVSLVPKPRLKPEFEMALAETEVRARGSAGNILTRHSVRKISLIPGKEIPKADLQKTQPATQTATPTLPRVAEKPLKTDPSKTVLQTRAFGYDEKSGLAGFSITSRVQVQVSPQDKVVFFYQDGSYIVWNAQESLEVGKGVIHTCVWDSQALYMAVYLDGESSGIYARRFTLPTVVEGKYFYFISDWEESRLLLFSAQPEGKLEIQWKTGKPQTEYFNITSLNCPLAKVGQPGLLLGTRNPQTVKLAPSSQLSLL